MGFRRKSRLSQPWADLHAAYSLLHGLSGRLRSAEPFLVLAKAAVLGLADEELNLREGRRLLTGRRS